MQILKPEFTKIKYKVYDKTGKFQSVSYSLCVDEYGLAVIEAYTNARYKSQHEAVIARDLRYYKNCLPKNSIIKIYLDNEFFKEIRIKY
jgi:hypothetical protein